MGVVRTKDGVEFNPIAPGGFRILQAINYVAGLFEFDLTITSGSDGVHSGPDDPHKLGNAYDVRSKDVPENEKQSVLYAIQGALDPNKFYAFLEDPGTDNEHYHIQVKKGTTYP